MFADRFKIFRAPPHLTLNVIWNTDYVIRYLCDIPLAESFLSKVISSNQGAHVLGFIIMDWSPLSNVNLQR